ncbi:MAG TPA: peptide-methionine (S)-S-oxide reductase MsrA [Sphingomicrobium sp.]|jgi:peptide-methionine (S)-S-oxide reductase|nr:peptide-methionine (S)-S-oxide reductase MsrA [Sphingomicrobium sp.]
MIMKHWIAAILLTIAAPAWAAPQMQTAVLAGGCFWGMEWVFEHVKGVTGVVSGYAGGSAQDASYDKVSSESTGHAEAVRITYDPSQVNYARLLEVYFTVAHDPTELNRQGPDVGSSYRSAIFPQSAEQERFARAYIGKLNASHLWHRPIATRIEHGTFYPAEKYHQHFAAEHPYFPYILVNDRPKIAALRQKFPALYKG